VPLEQVKQPTKSNTPAPEAGKVLVMTSPTSPRSIVRKNEITTAKFIETARIAVPMAKVNYKQ